MFSVFQVNCETDFVARNEKFIAMVTRLVNECSAHFEKFNESQVSCVLSFCLHLFLSGVFSAKFVCQVYLILCQVCPRYSWYSYVYIVLSVSGLAATSRGIQWPYVSSLPWITSPMYLQVSLFC